MHKDIISLGNNCNPGLSLRELGLKGETYPFDWIRSNPKIIYDILVNGPDRFLQFGQPEAADDDTISNFEIKHMFACFLKKKRGFPSSHINFYGQYFTNYMNKSADELKETFKKYTDRLFDKLKNSDSITFIHTTENYIFHKLSRDHRDIYFDYLIRIEEHIERHFPNLDFQIINIDIDKREDARHIVNYQMRYSLPYADYCETAMSVAHLKPFRDEITDILRTIL